MIEKYHINIVMMILDKFVEIHRNLKESVIIKIWNYQEQIILRSKIFIKKMWEIFKKF